MSRKDSILQSFLSHPIIAEKYETSIALPNSLDEALKSEAPIIKAIALIIQALETNPQPTDTTLKNIINQYLSTKAI